METKQQDLEQQLLDAEEAVDGLANGLTKNRLKRALDRFGRLNTNRGMAVVSIEKGLERIAAILDGNDEDAVLGELRELLEAVDDMMMQDAEAWPAEEMLASIDSLVKEASWFSEVRRDGDPYAPPRDHDMSFVYDVGEIQGDIYDIISNAEHRMKDVDQPSSDQMHEWLIWRLRESWWVRAIVAGLLGERLEVEEVAAA